MRRIPGRQALTNYLIELVSYIVILVEALAHCHRPLHGYECGLLDILAF